MQSVSSPEWNTLGHILSERTYNENSCSPLHLPAISHGARAAQNDDYVQAALAAKFLKQIASTSAQNI